MSRWNALKKTYRMCTRLRAQRGGHGVIFNQRSFRVRAGSSGNPC